MGGRQRFYPVRLDADIPGDVGSDACEAAFKGLCTAVRDELLMQDVGLMAAGGVMHIPTCKGSCDDHMDIPAHINRVDPRVLLELGHLVAAHISTVPGMQVVMQGHLRPALWQPLFAICVGHSQLRVLTFAFVGEPVIGDRPASKRTPWVLRLATDDLLHTARIMAARAPRPTVSSVHYLTEPSDSDACSIMDHTVCLEKELFSAVSSGNWTQFITGSQPAAQVPTLTPQSPAVTVQSPTATVHSPTTTSQSPTLWRYNSSSLSPTRQLQAFGKTMHAAIQDNQIKAWLQSRGNGNEATQLRSGIVGTGGL